MGSQGYSAATLSDGGANHPERHPRHPARHPNLVRRAALGAARGPSSNSKEIAAAPAANPAEHAATANADRATQAQCRAGSKAAGVARVWARRSRGRAGLARWASPAAPLATLRQAQFGGSPNAGGMIGAGQAAGAARTPAVAPATLSLPEAINIGIQNNLTTLLADERAVEAPGHATANPLVFAPNLFGTAFQQNRTLNLQAQGLVPSGGDIGGGMGGGGGMPPGGGGAARLFRPCGGRSIRLMPGLISRRHC
ncbi:MAG: hypothetical protein WKG07_17620 [Hymenobacter sp.]